jgi:hypothetical protein
LAVSSCNLTMLASVREDFTSSYESAGLFRSGETGINVTEGNSVGADAKRWPIVISNCGMHVLRCPDSPPFLRYRLAEASDTSLSQAVVGLSSVPVSTRRAADVDDASWLSVLDSEVGSSLSDEPEWCSVVYSEDSIPLLIGNLMDDAVPRVASVVYDVMKLAATKLGGLLYQDFKVGLISDITWDSNCAVGRGIVDCFGGRVGLC